MELQRRGDYSLEPKVVQKSPFVIEEAPGRKFWCACGLSSTEPYCDGSHKGTGIAPVFMKIEEKQIVAWCGCKHTANKPFCDGSHNSL